MDLEEDVQWEYVGAAPYTKENAEFRLNSEEVEFILPRKKRGRSYSVVFTAKWFEIVSFDCSEIVFCKDDKTWPLDEPLPSDFKEIGPAGIFFAFLRAGGEAFFQIWSIIPFEDVPRVREIAEKYLGRPSVPGLAHHGTTAAVNYVLNHCQVVERIKLNWHDWIKVGPSTRPREKFQEIDPELVICREGMAFNFHGASAKLKQMSTFWPWRLLKTITTMDDEVPQIAYVWHEDSYTFQQQVWEDEERKEILKKVTTALQAYREDQAVDEFVLVRPWSFPSVFHDTWDDLQPFASKPSRDGFPPITETNEYR
ncbi:MAG: hypothetical protein EAX95_08955 [Candidatus Thorarchaeota archaeon]|nr:hypothetical protein [Candidatus Thorarchaeota archaeon]